MKKWSCVFLLLTSLTAISQEVIISAPLSVEEEDGRKIIERPLDGQLKLEASEPAKTAKEEVVQNQPEEKKEVPVEKAEAKKENKVYQTYLGAEKFVQFSFGYLNSNYEKIDPVLDNGSTLTTFRFVSDMNQRFQTGFAMEVINDNSGQALPDSIRVLQYKMFVDYHAAIFPSKVDYLLGLSFSVGNYSLQKLSLNAQGEQVNTKIKSGSIFGIAPSAGVRIYLVERNSIDIVVEYHEYFSKPQRYIGGFAFAPRFSFVF